MAKSKNNFIVELKLNTNNNSLAVLSKRFDIAERMYNVTLKFAIKQINRMKENKDYKYAFKKYLYYKTLNDKENIKFYANLLADIRLDYSLSEYSLHSFIKKQQIMYKKHIDSFTAQKIASTVWIAVESVLFNEGKKLHFKKKGTISSLEGKSNNTGIRYLKDKSILAWNKLNIPVKIRKNDLFVQESLLRNIKYCRIVRKPFKNGYKYFIQLILEGIPPAKRIHSKTNHGAFRHTASPNNRVGINIGVSTIAVCSQEEIILTELAKNSEKYNKEIIKLCRKLDRSKRGMNPNKFNNDGTTKKFTKVRWIYSKNYIKTLFKLKNLYRRKSNYIKIEHNKLANKIMSLGKEIYVEDVNFKALQKHSKEITINSKGGYNKKVYFGKILNDKAPSKLIEIINQKLGYENLTINKINTRTFKSIQYNHYKDEYINQDLNERWNNINGNKVQRDLYNSFLIMNSNKDLKSTNKFLCDKTYNNFLVKHNKLIEEINMNSIKYPKVLG